jgi:antitoxin CptB|tara:strand:+ start:278 stop:547 length:270 start_codon:yes stop_codon:yes gene_type:complete
LEVNVTENIEAKRAIWHSRRGMLELDVLLLPFAQEAYTQLDDDDQARYRALLDREDPDLFTWFMEHSKPDDPDMERIVTLVLEHARNRR